VRYAVRWFMWPVFLGWGFATLPSPMIGFVGSPRLAVFTRH
jgi:hypothetical protein